MESTTLHLVYLEMKQSGVTDEDHMNRSFQVYLDLCEVRNWWNVRFHPSVKSNVIFLSGRPERGVAREFVLTVGSDQSLSSFDTQCYIQEIEELCQTELDGLTVAILDTDSTTAYYKLSIGLVPPLPLVAESKYKKRQNWRGRQFAYPAEYGKCDIKGNQKHTSDVEKARTEGSSDAT